MAEVDLGPVELDLLEDALEELEHDGALERWLDGEDVSPRVRERLADYHALLVASREALPLEDVPAGVLDGVLAEAQQAAAAAPAVAVASGDTWWSRMRRSFMVPVLALAGTAALVLWVFDPEEQGKVVDPPAPTGSASTPAMQTPIADDAEQAEEETRREAPERPDQAAAAATPAAQPAPPADEAIEGGLPGADRNDGADKEKKKDAKPSPYDVPAMGSLGDVPGTAGLGGAKAEPPPKSGGSAGPASGRWDLVSRGDRARQAGDCVAAREEYALALEDDEARVRARAFAGMGLCDAQAGDSASADANFERARELDGEIGGFIESQEQRSRPAQKRKKASKKPKSKLDAFEDVNDPFAP